MLLLGGGGLRHGGLRLRQHDGRRGRRGLEPAHIATTGESSRAQNKAQRGRRRPQAAAFNPYVPF
ncbi:hypothetical protein GCM10007858_27360 [Bradyrhizobium liaoningense]|nr:hypothetical protein GCM10007858_27360 [Bradyrhizobium liaoningense]